MYRKAAVGDVIRSRLFGRSDSSMGGFSGQLTHLVGTGRHDRVRGRALFVVEEAEQRVCESLGTAWQVRARQLAADGTYDPEAEMISFYQEEGIYSWNIVKPRNITLVGKMSVRFVWRRRFRAA